MRLEINNKHTTASYHWFRQCHVANVIIRFSWQKISAWNPIHQTHSIPKSTKQFQFQFGWLV